MSEILSSNVTRSSASVGSSGSLQAALDRVLQGQSLCRPPVRIADPAEVDSIRADLLQEKERLVERSLRAAAHAPTPATRILAILRAGSMSRGLTGWDDPTRMAVPVERLERLVQRRATLPLALLLGGEKANNVLKTGDVILPDVTEWMAVIHLAAMAEAIGRTWDPGAVVLAIPDAPLHTADLAVPWSEAREHMNAMRRDLAWLGLTDLVAIPDTPSLLPATWSAEVMRQKDAVVDRMRTDPAYAASLEPQTRSLVYSVNTRSAPWSFGHTVQVYGSLSGLAAGEEASRDAAHLVDWSRRITPHYVAVNHTIRLLDLAGRAAEQATGCTEHLRLSVHAKTGEPRPVLMPGNRFTRPGLLPMHGLGLRFHAEGRARWSHIFELEARVSGYQPVHATDGRFLFFETGR